MKSFNARAVAICGSTGATEVITKIFTDLKGLDFEFAFFITQHMAINFVPQFTEKLKLISGREVFMAATDLEVRNNNVYIAASGYHLGVKLVDGRLLIEQLNTPAENFCKPAADPMLRSLVSVYRSGLLTLILTGIGSDGLNGASEVKKRGGYVVAQEEKSCVVYGMPKAVIEAGVSECVADPDGMVTILRMQAK